MSIFHFAWIGSDGGLRNAAPHPMVCVRTAAPMAAAFPVRLPHMLLTPTFIYLNLDPCVPVCVVNTKNNKIKNKSATESLTYFLRQSVERLDIVTPAFKV